MDWVGVKLQALVQKVLKAKVGNEVDGGPEAGEVAVVVEVWVGRQRWLDILGLDAWKPDKAWRWDWHKPRAEKTLNYTWLKKHSHKLNECTREK